MNSTQQSTIWFTSIIFIVLIVGIMAGWLRALEKKNELEFSKNSSLKK